MNEQEEEGERTRERGADGHRGEEMYSRIAVFQLSQLLTLANRMKEVDEDEGRVFLHMNHEGGGREGRGEGGTSVSMEMAIKVFVRWMAVVAKCSNSRSTLTMTPVEDVRRTRRGQEEVPEERKGKWKRRLNEGDANFFRRQKRRAKE